MKRSEIQVGKVYAVKVSGNLVPVKITTDRGTYTKAYAPSVKSVRYQDIHQGWNGINELSGRKVLIRSPQKCRVELRHDGAKYVPVSGPAEVQIQTQDGTLFGSFPSAPTNEDESQMAGDLSRPDRFETV